MPKYDGTERVPRGKYGGKTMEEVPSDYLRYIVNNWDDEDLVDAADAEYQHREQHRTHFWSEGYTRG